MPQPHHENTLNVWTADILREDYGLDAHQEQKQASGGRIDIEVRIGPVKIALEAEQGQNAAKKREGHWRRRQPTQAQRSRLRHSHLLPGRNIRQGAIAR